MENCEEVRSAKQKGAQGQTGPKTERGKCRSKMNALKHGRFAKSALLPFEDETAFKAHLRDIRTALLPNDYVEQQIVDEYAHALWRLQRQENRTAYERERILDKLTAPMMAEMLGVPPESCAVAPSYLLDPKHKVSAVQHRVANLAYAQYGRFMKEAKGAANLNLVWRNFPDLFRALGAYIEHMGSLKPLFTDNQKDLNIAWQQHPQKILEHLAVLSKKLYYTAKFNEFKPQIRLYMESWYFAQHHELKRLERDDAGLMTERKHANAMLDKLMQLRRTQYALRVATLKAVDS